MKMLLVKDIIDLNVVVDICTHTKYMYKNISFCYLYFIHKYPILRYIILLGKN